MWAPWGLSPTTLIWRRVGRTCLCGMQRQNAIIFCSTISFDNNMQYYVYVCLQCIVQWLIICTIIACKQEYSWSEAVRNGHVCYVHSHVFTTAPEKEESFCNGTCRNDGIIQWEFASRLYPVKTTHIEFTAWVKVDTGGDAFPPQGSHFPFWAGSNVHSSLLC